MSTAVVLGVRIMKGLSKNNLRLSSSHSAPGGYRQKTNQSYHHHHHQYTDHLYIHRVHEKLHLVNIQTSSKSCLPLL